MRGKRGFMMFSDNIHDGGRRRRSGSSTRDAASREQTLPFRPRRAKESETASRSATASRIGPVYLVSLIASMQWRRASAL